MLRLLLKFLEARPIHHFSVNLLTVSSADALVFPCSVALVTLK